MREAVIVSTARTPIARAFRGAFNNIKSPTLLGHAIMHAVQRAGIDPGEIDDVVIGTVLGAGTAGKNIARNASLAAGLPITVAAQTRSAVLLGSYGNFHRGQADHRRRHGCRRRRRPREYLRRPDSLLRLGLA